MAKKATKTAYIESDILEEWFKRRQLVPFYSHHLEFIRNRTAGRFMIKLKNNIDLADDAFAILIVKIKNDLKYWQVQQGDSPCESFLKLININIDRSVEEALKKAGIKKTKVFGLTISEHKSTGLNAVYISDVIAGSAGYDANLKRNDIINMVNGNKIQTKSDFAGALQKAMVYKNDFIEIDIIRSSRHQRKMLDLSDASMDGEPKTTRIDFLEALMIYGKEPVEERLMTIIAQKAFNDLKDGKGKLAFEANKLDNATPKEIYRSAKGLFVSENNVKQLIGRTAYRFAVNIEKHVKGLLNAVDLTEFKSYKNIFIALLYDAKAMKEKYKNY